MSDLWKYAIILLVLAPFLFVAEAFYYGAPTTINENTRNVREACRSGGGTREHCDCVAETFRAKLDSTNIAMKRIMFVRDTIPNKQRLYEEADRTCRN